MNDETRTLLGTITVSKEILLTHRVQLEARDEEDGSKSIKCYSYLLNREEGVANEENPRGASITH